MKEELWRVFVRVGCNKTACAPRVRDLTDTCVSQVDDVWERTYRLQAHRVLAGVWSAAANQAFRFARERCKL